MKVTLGTFARSGLEAFVGGDVAAGAQVALQHYTRRLRSGVKPPEFPRFRRSLPEGEGTVFDVPIDPEIEASLQREMHRQGASLEELTAHAVLVYLADIDRSFWPEVEPEHLTLL